LGSRSKFARPGGVPSKSVGLPAVASPPEVRRVLSRRFPYRIIFIVQWMLSWSWRFSMLRVKTAIGVACHSHDNKRRQGANRPAFGPQAARRWRW
jgi:hypothetical protein